MPHLDIGILVNSPKGYVPITSIGDTLGLTALIKELYNSTGHKSIVSTMVPDIFANNPYVEKTYMGTTANIKLAPCIEYKCNIIQNYFSQLSLPTPDNLTPEIYLSENEISYAKTHLQKYKGNKIVAVCLNSSADSRDLRYSTILPLLEKLKKEGYILISIGQSAQPQDIYHESFVNVTTLRQVFALINECDFYLGVDTGLFHAAAALNTPQVVFFRHNGCSNNAYHNTYFLDSKQTCPGRCHKESVFKCFSTDRCMDSFNFDEYYKMILTQFPT